MENASGRGGKYIHVHVHIILKPQSDDFEGDTELTDSVKCPQ